jgi:nucleotide-binding universal stress UspA family protein
MTLTKIVVGTDFSAEAESAVGHAMGIARQTGAELILVHAINPSITAYNFAYPVARPELYETQVESILQAARKELDETQERYRGQGVEITPTFVDQPPADALRSAAEETEAELVVVGSHGRGRVAGLLMGSVSHQMAKKAKCDVLIARGEPPEGGYERILVPIDFSEITDLLVARAMELVAEGGHVELFHCWHLPGGPAVYWGMVGPGLRQSIRDGTVDLAKTYIERFRSDRATLTFTEKEGDARRCIRKRASTDEFDLVMVATHTHKGLERLLLGSVAEYTVHHAELPTYLLRGPA